MRIDVHAHHYPQNLNDRMEALGSPFIAGARGAPSVGVTLDQRIELMDRAKVDVQVLCEGAQHPYFDNADKAIEGARFANDLYIDVVAKHGGRFAAFGVVPLPHVDAAIKEAGRCLDELHMPGINLGCSVYQRPLDDPEFEPFWAEMNRRRAVINLHPLGIGGPMADVFGLDWLVCGCFEDTVTAARLIGSGLTTRYPHVSIIVPHLGGTVPYLWARLRSVGRQANIDSHAALRHLYYDTANHAPGGYRFAAGLLGSDRMMLGTDFPYQTGDQFVRDVLDVEESGLPKDEIDAILDRNAQALLKL